MTLYNKTGVYVIINKVDNRKYVGGTVDLGGRRLHHFSRLKENDHHNPNLQNTYNKYGGDIFEFSVVLFCEEFELLRYEQALVDYYGINNLYNIREHVESNLGLTHSPETIEIMSAIKIGDKNPFYGKKHTKESLEKNRRANSGKNNAFYGKKHSDETIEKLRFANAKLSEENVKEIKKLLKSESETIKNVAKKYGVSPRTIYDIKNGRTWKNVQ